VPDVNLLPRDQREKERKELELARHAPKRVDIVLTNPPKEAPSPFKKTMLLKETFWQKLFKKPGASKPPVTLIPPKPLAGLSSSPSLLPTKEPIKEIVAKPLPGPKLSLWSRLFGSGSKKPVPVAPKAPGGVPHAPAPVSTPFVKGPNLLEQQFPPSAPKPQSPVAPPPPKKASPTPPIPPKPAAPAPNLATAEHQQFSSLPKGNKVKFTQVKSEEKPKESRAVSLLPDELRPRDGDVETKLVLTVIAALFIAAGIVGGGLFVVKSLRLGAETQFQNVMSEQRQKLAEFSSKEADLAAGELIQKKISVVDQLLDNHVYWTKWLAWLEAKTDPGVQWAKMSAQADQQSLVLSGSGENLLAVARQVIAFRAMAGVREVKITSATASMKDESLPESEGGTFSMTIEVTLEPSYVEEVPDPQDSSKTIQIHRGMFTTTREEALYDSGMVPVVSEQGDGGSTTAPSSVSGRRLNPTFTVPGQ